MEQTGLVGAILLPSLLCPNKFPSSAAEKGPFPYGQTAGAHVRAACVEEKFLKRGVNRCDYKQPNQGTEGLKSL